MCQNDLKVWGIHATDNSSFLQNQIIGLNWKEMGDLSRLEATFEAFKKSYSEHHPDKPVNHIGNCAGQLYRFTHVANIGDYVVYSGNPDKLIHIGRITGSYEYHPDESCVAHIRKVEWLKAIPRIEFSQGALHEAGSAMSFFNIKNYSKDFIDALNDNCKKSTNIVADDTVQFVADDIKANTNAYIIQRLSSQLKGYSLEDFIAELLNAMGYRTTRSKQGGDNGIDIKAYKDELPPRIVVQVKSQSGNVVEKDIQALKGAMQEGDYGFFVTLSDYTKNAKSFLEANPHIRGINGDELAGLIIKYYHKLSDRCHNIIPLERVYIPIGSDEL